MTTNAGPQTMEQSDNIINTAKQEAELAEELGDKEWWKRSKKAIEEEKKEMDKKDKEKEETITITSIDDLPKNEKEKENTYKREAKKSYKMEFKEVSYEFYNNGKTKITKGETTEIKKTQDVISDVQKLIDQKAEAEKAEQAEALTKKATDEKIKQDEQQKKDEQNKEKENQKKENEKIENQKKENKKNETKEWKVVEETKTNEEITEIHTYHIEVKGKEMRGCMDTEWNIVIEASYEWLEISSDKPPVIKFQEKGKRGLMDAKGNQIIEPIYESMYFTEEWNIACKLDNKWWVLDKTWVVIDSFKIA